jgi:hypothetical protein
VTDEINEEVTPAPKRDFYLKFASESEMMSELADVTTLDEDDNRILITAGHDFAIDPIGTMYQATGNTLTDSEGNDYPEMAAVSGYHVNVRLISETYREMFEIIDETFGVDPATPQRVFA